MVRHNRDFPEFDIVAGRNRAENDFDSILGVIVPPDVFAVFGAPGKVVPEVVARMRGVMNGHTLIIPKSFSTRLLSRSDSPMPEHRGLARDAVNPP